MQVYKVGSSSEPKFPDSYEVAKKAVLQVTDIKTNRNKYYAIELHSAKDKFRVFTHYGRTDDLDTNPNAGVREVRHCSSLSEAESVYSQIFREKTSATKGYKEVNLASSKIGSNKSVGTSSGTIDDKTLQKLAEKDKAPTAKPVITIATEVQDLVSYLYSEATNALVSTVNASITANGIETPLGVLTIGQIDKGQDVLDQIASAFNKKKKDKDELIDLSGQFYTVIPHKFGRSKEAALSAVINTAEQINDKQDTLQLMRDMLNVNGKTNVLMNPEVEQKYKALDCHLSMVPHSSDDFKKISKYVIDSQVGYKGLKVKNIFTIKREKEHAHFTTTIKNHKQLFHGSRVKNWVGILSRGILLPKIVVTLGVTRTDAGWLGSGIYFGDAITVASNYAGTGTGKRNTSFVALTNVALGKMKDFNKITYGLSKPPDGFDSCHGVRGTQFADDEYVIYDHSQQRMDYLLEVSR